MVDTLLSHDTLPTSSARQFVTDALDTWRLPTAVVKDAELVVSELVANAVQHGTGPTNLTIASTGSVIRIAVSDHSTAPPVLHTPEPTEPRHRGLVIVAALSADWGCEVTATGKTVWAELTVQG